MKRYWIGCFFLFLGPGLFAQDLVDRMAEVACKCLDSLALSSGDSINYKICLAQGMAVTMEKASEEDRVKMDRVENIRKTIEQLQNRLMQNCPLFKSLILQERTDWFYAPSSVKEANVHFNQGVVYSMEKDYAKAITEYRQALKADDKFVKAWDNLAVVYRKSEKYRKALACYDNSLKLFPEGRVALLNKGILLEAMKEYERALKSYQFYIHLYPENPEGYCGAARVYYAQQDYEHILDYLLPAHRLYVESNSQFQGETGRMIDGVYNGMKAKGQEELFKAKFEEYNFVLGEE